MCARQLAWLYCLSGLFSTISGKMDAQKPSSLSNKCVSGSLVDKNVEAICWCNLVDRF